MRISIITVCYNSVETIERTIKSVIGQDYHDIEYIVIDGGSTDGTVEVIQKYEKHISYWVSEKDKGIYDAMNKGIKNATGEILAFLNSDDWYEENILDDIAHVFQKEKIQVLCGGIFFHRNDIVVRRYVNKEAIEKEIRFKMGYYHSAMFVKKSLFIRYGMFDTRYKIVADYDWLLRVYDGHENIAATNKVFSNFSYGGISSRYEMLDLHLQERKNASMSALMRNEELTEEEKKTWREIIEYKCVEDRYYSAFKKILGDIEKNRDDKLLERVKLVFVQDRYAIFGCGVNFGEVSMILRRMNIRITMLWDNDEKKWGKIIDGIVVSNPEDIESCKDMIIIASTAYESEIEMQLENRGFRKGIHYLLYSELRKKIVDSVEMKNSCALDN